MHPKRLLRLAPALLLLLLAGCERHLPTSAATLSKPGGAVLDRSAVQSRSLGAQHLAGEIGPGALYTIDVPEPWNGDLVVYAHGYTLPQVPVVIPSGQDGFDGIRDLLLARGFGVAVTSFSENGYAEAEGARQVHQLSGLFASRVSKPNRTFLLGQSLGGIIGIHLAEKFPSQYAGALFVSGVLGGTAREVDYFGDIRVIFDFYSQGVLGGTVTEVPDIPYPQDAVVQSLLTHPERIGLIACTFRDQNFRVAGRNGTELLTSIARVLGFQWLAAEDLVGRTHDHQLYDNTGVSYVGCVPASVLAAFNAGVVRYAATPDAENYMRNNYEPTGQLSIPVLTLHAANDPVVPAGHEDVYYAKAAAAGSLDHLLQCRYDRYGHTEAFHPAEVVQAFDALVGWATTGQKPNCPEFPTP
jgi:pimeloyl-ACP methyl ester carboxylesterase